MWIVVHKIKKKKRRKKEKKRKGKLRNSGQRLNMTTQRRGQSAHRLEEK